MPVNGQIVRLYEASHPTTGEWILVVEAHSERGNIVGSLVVPTNGDEGICRFQPMHELQAATLEELPTIPQEEVRHEGAQSVQAAADAAAAKPIGTITSDKTPKRKR